MFHDHDSTAFSINFLSARIRKTDGTEDGQNLMVKAFPNLTQMRLVFLFQDEQNCSKHAWNFLGLEVKRCKSGTEVMLHLRSYFKDTAKDQIVI